MGHDITRLKEPDPNQVAKRLARQSRPCTMELLNLMDCMKKAGPEGESACSQERKALARCAAQGTKKSSSTAVSRPQLVRYLKEFVAAAKRFR